MRDVLFLALGVAFAAGAVRGADDPGADFARDVLPILERACFRCHEGREAKAGTRLDRRSSVLATEASLVVPGDPAGSPLLRRIESDDPDDRMPPEGPRLRQRDVEALRRWIAAGAHWDETLLPEDDGSDHWAFQPVERPAVPRVPGADVANAIDAFATAAQHERGLTPAPRADRRTLVRRLWLDVLGLPPAMEDVEAFERDERPDAWARLVDRVLASPRYGERWGRHWLDVARWAESEGYESNHDRPSAWRYRDWVVESLNVDRPFDEFVRQQLAGDELPEFRDEYLVATGFLAAARISSNEEDKWLQRNDVNVDVVNAVGTAFLGLTLHCAQCHDHKFDPISARDYYGLQAFFVRGQPSPVRMPTSPAEDAEVLALVERRRAIFDRAHAAFVEQRDPELAPEERAALAVPTTERSVDDELLARRALVRMQFSNTRVLSSLDEEEREEYDRLSGEIDERSAGSTFAFYSPVTSPHALVVLDAPGFYPLPFDEEWFAGVRPYVMTRGDVHSIGERVAPAWPARLRLPTAADEGADRERTRLDLANWLVDPGHPLVARVFVNRVWQHHFGRGIVASVDDFGVRGARPSHPELLDWLADEFVRSGWSTKHLHRLILQSETYRRSSGTSEANLELDPDGAHLTRWMPRRLEAETIRDALLVASGDLVEAPGGPSVSADDAETSLRRSLYLFQRRGRPADMQGLFDGPSECAASEGRREVSTSPLQPLYLLNAEFSLRRAESLAARVRRRAGADAESRIVEAFRVVLQRAPTNDERIAAAELLDRLAGDFGVRSDSGESPGPGPLVLFCQALLNCNEFSYVE